MKVNINYKKMIQDLTKEYNPATVDECLQLIGAIAVDYDGYNTVQSLKELIDEIAHYARCARDLLNKGECYSIACCPHCKHDGDIDLCYRCARSHLLKDLFEVKE